MGPYSCYRTWNVVKITIDKPFTLNVYIEVAIDKVWLETNKLQIACTCSLYVGKLDMTVIRTIIKISKLAQSNLFCLPFAYLTKSESNIFALVFTELLPPFSTAAITIRQHPKTHGATA